MAITTLDTLIEAMPGQAQPFIKSFDPHATGDWFALFQQVGVPGAGAAPSSGVGGDVPTDATAGAFPFTNPTGGDKTYIGVLGVAASIPGTLFIYDRLWHNSGLSVTSTSSQTVNSSTLTRPDANGADVELWLQIYTTMGSGTPTITASYTDQDGNSGNTATLLALATTAQAGRTFPFQLASGDTGIRTVQSYQQSATMTSGTHGLVLRRRLATIPMPVAGVGVTFDSLENGLPEVPDDACLELLWQSTSATALIVQGMFRLLQG